MKKINNLSEYQSEYQKSIDSPEKFWEEKASTFQWISPWEKTLEWEFNSPSVQWFLGGKLNITENCLDRHLNSRSNQTAIIWEPNNPKEATVKISYKELYSKVCTFSNVLKNNGAK